MRKNLGRKVTTMIMIFSMILMVSSTLLTGLLYYRSEFTEASRTITHHLKSLAELVSGDDVERYYETLEVDDKYIRIQNYIETIQKNSDLLYFYVYVPRENDVVYIWDTEDAGEIPLGYVGEYWYDDKEDSMRAMQGEAEDRVIITNHELYGTIGSIYYPIRNSAGNAVALAGADISISVIYNRIWKIEGLVILSFLVIIVLCMGLLDYRFKHDIVVPIRSLDQVAKEMVYHLEDAEELDFRITTHDEIQDLGDTFKEMFIEVKDYIRQLETVTSEQQKISTELNVAMRIQRAALPEELPDSEFFELSASMDPAKEVGGDFYDYYFLDDDHLVLTIADVSGKGIPAALFMMVSKLLLKSQSPLELSPAAILASVNDRLCVRNEAEMFVTVWLGVVELSTGRVTAANAGHEYPVLRKADGSFELIHDRHGLVLGGMPGMKYRDYEFEIEKGGTLFVYTDGVPEASNAQNELFGMDRMLDALNVRPDAAPSELLREVRSCVDRFVDHAPQFDDLTMLGFKRK